MLRTDTTWPRATRAVLLPGFLAVACGAMIALAPAPTAAPVQELPPVLLVTIDTLRHDGLGVYGGRAATPAIDALAARGVRFEQAVAHAVLTLPSHTSILTGLDPSRHGVHDNAGFRVSDALDTWAERFQAAGFATGAFVGAFPLDSRFGLAQGFDLYDDYYDTGGANRYRIVERTAQDVVTPARRWIRRQRDSWFAWVHVYDPHAAYAPPPPFDEDYADDPYAGEIAYTDSALAPLLEDAARLGALVIVTSDHGEGRGDHGELTHGVLAYNSTVRVPLIVAGPGVAEGAVARRRVAHADLLATVLDRYGLPDDGVQGVSFNDLLDSGAPGEIGEEVVYFEALNPNLTRNWAPLRGVFRGQWKFIDLPLPELYDVLADPGEQEEMSRSRGSVMVDLNRVLSAHLEGAAAMDAPLAEDPETMRQLRSLGYLGGGGGPADREYGPDDDPKNLVHLDALMQQAMLDLSQARFDDALQQLETLLAERADFTQAVMMAASAEEQLGRVDAAIDRLRTATEQAWATSELQRDFGALLHRSGRLVEAEEVMTEVVEQQPRSVEALNVLSLVYRDTGRLVEARQLVARALELDPTYAELYVNRAELLLRSGRPQEARAALDQALEYDPSLAEAHNMLGKIAADDGRIEEAIESWRTAISHDARAYDAMRNLGIQLVRQNRFAEAVDVLERLFEAAPERLYEEYQIPQLREMVERIKADHGIG